MSTMQPALALDLCSHFTCPGRRATHFTNVRRASDDAVFTLMWCDDHKGPESRPLPSTADQPTGDAS